MTMIPLTVRSQYSLMWGTASIPDLCRTAKQLGYRRLALTDTDNLYGLMPFLAACRREGLGPIVGAELTGRDGKQRAVCLVETADGYRHLCRLITRRRRDEEFDLEQAVISHARGLKVLTRHPDLLTAWHDAGIPVGAAMPRAPLPPSHRLCRTAKRLGVPSVATPGIFFIRPAAFHLHCLLRAVSKNTGLSRLAPGDVAPADAWLASPDAYRDRFRACPDAVEATERFAESLTFTGPAFGTVLPPWKDPGGRDAVE